jgi:hypothetical protein
MHLVRPYAPLVWESLVGDLLKPLRPQQPEELFLSKTGMHVTTVTPAQAHCNSIKLEPEAGKALKVHDGDKAISLADALHLRQRPVQLSHLVQDALAKDQVEHVIVCGDVQDGALFDADVGDRQLPQPLTSGLDVLRSHVYAQDVARLANERGKSLQLFNVTKTNVKDPLAQCHACLLQ